ncbi:thioesterase-like superfamily-domain-containing protein [Mycena maculata]|uniref:Thioesterase-like superfamily-domain-containing protein n=1 Tax=Mycena maculata TaxID=230809 RepID=A0AAD7NXA6_9AGAR|nr:thioesterase-like superfamily-domain-containing protein [Mycena maculata]
MLIPSGLSDEPTGYALSLILQSCIQNQVGSAHPDPLHLSAHFLQPTRTSSFEVHLRILKRGRNFINIIADLVQENHTCITAHLIFGKIPPSSPPIKGYTRRHPLVGHPSNAIVSESPKAFGFGHRVRWAEDPDPLFQNETNSPIRNQKIGGLAVWSAWLELVDPEDRLTLASLSLFADCVKNVALLFPASVTGVDPNNLWLPTLSFSLEYKTPIPPPSALHSARTVGVYVFSGFLSEPQGRHDTYVEIWTAPSNIGEGSEVEGWRDAQVCLGIATQMQLIVKGTVNTKAAAKSSL